MKAATPLKHPTCLLRQQAAKANQRKKRKKEKKTNLPPIWPNSKPDAVPPRRARLSGRTPPTALTYCSVLLFLLLLLTTLPLFPLRPLKSLLHPALPPREGTNYRQTDGQITGLEGKWKRAGGEFGGWRVGGPVWLVKV